MNQKEGQPLQKERKKQKEKKKKKNWNEDKKRLGFLDEEVVPVVSLHDVSPMCLLPLDLPSTHRGASARG